MNLSDIRIICTTPRFFTIYIASRAEAQSTVTGLTVPLALLMKPAPYCLIVIDGYGGRAFTSRPHYRGIGV